MCQEANEIKVQLQGCKQAGTGPLAASCQALLQLCLTGMKHRLRCLRLAVQFPTALGIPRLPCCPPAVSQADGPPRPPPL